MNVKAELLRLLPRNGWIGLGVATFVALLIPILNSVTGVDSPVHVPDYLVALFGKFLHHEPARPGEGERHRDMNRETLAAYRRVFGFGAPPVLWPQPGRPVAPQAVAELQAKQRAILASAARLVKPGGRLVYATCSLLDAENEVIAAEFAAAHPDFKPLDAAEALAKAQVERSDELVENGALRLWPHRHATDGFFAVAWERAD